MNTLKKTTAGTVLGGAMLIGGGLIGGSLGLAHAAPQAQGVAGDGTVNVTVTANSQQLGVLQDVSIANAAALAGSVCPTAVIDSAALTQLDANGTKPANPCISGTGLSFTFAQNSPGESESAPGQNRAGGSSAEAPAPVTTEPNAVGRQGS